MNEAATARTTLGEHGRNAVGHIRRRLFGRLGNTGLVLGALFFLASLTPSLTPRVTVAQAALSGLCLAAGYGLGVLLRWLWGYLELPLPRAEGERRRRIVIAACAALAAFGLWSGQHWENIVRELMHLDPAGPSRILGVAVGAAVVALLAIVLGRAALMLVHAVMRLVARRIPRRIASVVGAIGGVLLLVGLVNGVIFSSILDMLDASYRQADALIPPDMPPPTAWDSPGSAQSLVAWDQLGRMGRRYVAARPTAEDLASFAGPGAKAPLRVYAGLPTGDTPEERARLALEELKRVGGFERKALIIITPTGTGWVDPSGIDGIEYLYRGDVASVAVQYSYLSSPLTLFLDPDTGGVTARALFREVYGHWRTLPREQRPMLYLHGLSLGALNSERSFQMFELLEDPFHGAVWSGPPFAASQWAGATRAREPGSPVWLPRFHDGSFVRFMNQHGSSTPAGTPWGPLRVVYLQYGSDAVTFFDRHGFFRKPELLEEPRPPDVSPSMRWYPVVTMMQMAMDTSLSMSAPMGFGHVYAPSHYIDAWLEATGIDDWSAEDVARLQRHLDERRAAELSKTSDATVDG
ncbi:alpha/beta hydrolase [Pseudoxanthomonas suwonensis]|uniref:alpha/beta hydrolase n=1 Tax=Pseudoxanthomonas suwonensis TaxID=314722 RepID=UPI0009E28237|nr:alpha/beta-hydrolase family protein [Pseudoxanthomonas suwonensis]